MMASDDFGQTFITDTDMARLKDVLGKVGKDYKIFIVDRGKATEADPQDTQTRQ